MFFSDSMSQKRPFLTLLKHISKVNRNLKLNSSKTRPTIKVSKLHPILAFGIR
jgi:hypothetical protein